jgi:Icc-related predicted phosphoesterase
LITHGPPYKILDKTSEGIDAGCEELAIAVQRIKPKIHAFGHIHETAGELKQDGIHYINASNCNLMYKIG